MQIIEKLEEQKKSLKVQRKYLEELLDEEKINILKKELQYFRFHMGNYDDEYNADNYYYLIAGFEEFAVPNKDVKKIMNIEKEIDHLDDKILKIDRGMEAIKLLGDDE